MDDTTEPSFAVRMKRKMEDVPTKILNIRLQPPARASGAALQNGTLRFHLTASFENYVNDFETACFLRHDQWAPHMRNVLNGSTESSKTSRPRKRSCEPHPGESFKRIRVIRGFRQVTPVEKANGTVLSDQMKGLSVEHGKVGEGPLESDPRIVSRPACDGTTNLFICDFESVTADRVVPTHLKLENGGAEDDDDCDENYVYDVYVCSTPELYQSIAFESDNVTLEDAEVTIVSDDDHDLNEPSQAFASEAFRIPLGKPASFGRVEGDALSKTPKIADNHPSDHSSEHSYARTGG